MSEPCEMAKGYDTETTIPIVHVPPVYSPTCRNALDHDFVN
jgi:hypothetical protein